MIGTGADKRPKEQAVAACLNIWSKKDDAQKMLPQADEDLSDFLDRCGGVYDMDECMMMWDEARAAAAEVARNAPVVMHKTYVKNDDDDTMEFVLSDATPDRYGDVINADGWDVKNFARNPIALFNHNSNFPIGKWKNLRVEKGALRGHLQMAPAGTSDRIDEIRKLVDAGILRAVSVGFRPIESKPLSKNLPGECFVKSELIETSLVSIPANPNALAIAKSLKISDDTIDLVFAGHGRKNEPVKRRSLNGEHADTQRSKRKETPMGPLGQRIADGETELVQLKDALNAHVASMDDNPDEASITKMDELRANYDTKKKSVDALKRAEQSLGTGSEPAEGDDGVVHRSVARPGAIAASGTPATPKMFATAGKQVKPIDHIFRSVVVALKHHVEKGARPMVDVLVSEYGQNQEAEKTRAVMGAMIQRAATVPATTTTAGWAADLVQVALGEFMSALMPVSVYPQLAAKGGSFQFGQNGIVSIPTRDTTPTIAGSFVGQGAPIPVRQGSFSAITLTPKKMAVISTMTREISEHSTPAIEGLIRQAILEDTAVAIDTVLLDANPATAIRPAGLRNGVSTVTPTGGGAVIAAVIGDLKGMIGALITASAGNFRSPVWLVNPSDAITIGLMQAAAGGDLPFRDEIAAGRLLGIPVIQSTSVTADTMYLIDAADFVTSSAPAPRFDVSDQAVLTQEDTTPLPIVDGSSVPAPNTRSLWQTDSIGIRMLWDINWAMRRTGMVQYVTPLGWN